MDDSSATTTATTTTDDTAGHVLHGEAAKDPVSGGKAPSLRVAVTGDEDDTEGHVRARGAKRATDEPEGSRRA